MYDSIRKDIDAEIGADDDFYTDIPRLRATGVRRYNWLSDDGVDGNNSAEIQCVRTLAFRHRNWLEDGDDEADDEADDVPLTDIERCIIGSAADFELPTTRVPKGPFPACVPPNN